MGQNASRYKGTQTTSLFCSLIGRGAEDFATRLRPLISLSDVYLAR